MSKRSTMKTHIQVTNWIDRAINAILDVMEWTNNKWSGRR